MTMRLTVDIIIFTIARRALEVLLVKRKYPPYKGRWAIPGGFVEEEEALDAAARRELEEETGVKDVYLEQLAAYGAPDRDPRGRVVTVAFCALVPAAKLSVRAASDAEDAAWFSVDALPALAFDHPMMMEDALLRLRSRLEDSSVGFELLPEKFTLTELQRVHEAILGKEIEKRNFRRRILERGLVKPLKEWRRDGVQRPAQFFRFVRKRGGKRSSRKRT